ncbi:TetR/AcrR family transcriptional regulator [Tomitella cavernea]|uniref:TetR/AcrR family transcriptional regulator n=1 Tax=Tomitella cavernea TaxID=1387982 RepID=A0ABP9CTU7_9ACTN|nr:TetR/AcrR family transcriptional regulator [Tomitella cavernea]
MDRTAADAPPPNTRPRNRRAMILAAASELFARRGYANTSMTDIAESVAIGPSALYRHFPGKQQLLAEVIDAGLEPMHRMDDEFRLGEHPDALQRLAAHALEHRLIGALWQREVRHLPAAERELFRARLRELTAVFTRRVQDARDELDAETAGLAAAMLLSALASPGLHNFAVDDAEYARVLAEVLTVVLEAPYPSRAGAEGTDGSDRAVGALVPLTEPPLPTPASRREELLIHAVRLFARDGYAAVGLDEIGAAAGISGPSVYNHFPSKLALLTTAFHRGTGTLFTGVSAAYSTSATAGDALRSLLSSYLEFARGNPHLVGLLATEIEHLSPEEREFGENAQRGYLREWTHLLCALHPDAGEAACRIRVSTTIDVINSAARMRRFGSARDPGGTLEPLCLRMLGIDAGGGADSR